MHDAYTVCVRQCKNSSTLYIIDNIFTAGCSYIIIIIIIIVGTYRYLPASVVIYYMNI